MTRSARTASNRLTTCGLVSCSRLFAVCGRCDRGRRYCSKECAALARRTQLRRAGRLYQASERGRQSHAARQARYRARRSRVTHQPDAQFFDLRQISAFGKQDRKATPGGVARELPGFSAPHEVAAPEPPARPRAAHSAVAT